MKPTLFLRFASVLTLIHCVLHTIGGILAPPSHGAEEASVIETMKSHRFDVMGSMRSYWDFFLGYGLFVTLALLVQGILFWQLGQSIRKGSAAETKPILVLFLFNYIVMAIISWRFFFIAPALTELLIAVCLSFALALLESGDKTKVEYHVG